MTISEVAKEYAITADTLRYYERIGLLPAIHRSGSGIRDYSEADCKTVSFVKCMRSAGVQIEALTEYMTLLRRGDDTWEARKQILVEQRDQLNRKVEEMQRTLEILNKKIDGYEGKMRRIEQEMSC
ncbi:MAG: MerR family transcriptional regulator [Oscillospiraceae bacterium]|jgi:DNA-binding transcriptional MerR regulator|nr:MerR family transcriptional regulator [Oscillospiraceae bacterium]